MAKQQKQNTLPLRNPQTTFVFSLKCKKSFSWDGGVLLQTTQDRCSVVASKLQCLQCLPLGLVQHGCCFLVVLFVLMDQTNVPKILRTKNEAEDYNIAEDDSSTSFFWKDFPNTHPHKIIPPKGSSAFDWTMIGSHDGSIFHLARQTTQRNS